MKGQSQGKCVQTALLPGMEDVQGRPDDDFYQTPTWLVRAALEALERYRWDIIRPVPWCTILDPGAGTGILAREAEARAQRKGAVTHVTAVELAGVRTGLYPSHWETHRKDFFWWARDGEAAQEGRTFDLVVTNPPFSRWDPWVEACLPLVAHEGALLVLGHTGFLGGQDRAPWWRAHPPTAIWVSPRRPHYRNNKGDQRDAAWFLWSEGYEGPTTLRWLPTEVPTGPVASLPPHAASPEAAP